MSAAEALPPVTSPWRDSSHITDHIPTAAELAACPPVDPSVHDNHRRLLSALSTQAAWQPAPAPDVEPFTVREMVLDRLDEAEGIFETLVEIAQEADQLDRLLDWPTNEKSGWE